MAVLRWLSGPHGLHEQAKNQQGIPASCVHVASSPALCGGECGTGHTDRVAYSPAYYAYDALPPGVPSVPEGAEQDAAVQEKPVASGIQLLE